MQRKYFATTCKLLTASLLLAACGSRMQEVQGSESHFLAACDDTCGGGLSCIDNRCTRACNDQQDCDGVSSDAVCVGSEQSGAQSGVCDRDSAAPCEEGGYRYALGDTWTCSDGCNTCKCTEDGTLSTGRGCGASIPCQDGALTYELGEMWQCSDGCNTCYCTEDGVESTAIACTTTCEYGDNTEYEPGDVVEVDGGATCVCQNDGTLGQCTGVAIDAGAPTDPAVSSEPADGGLVNPDAGARCYLPSDSGDCEAAFLAFYFDAESGQCLEFTWGGCGGNDNRFDTLEACYAACGRDAN